MKITKSELKEMIREALREELTQKKPLNEASSDWVFVYVTYQGDKFELVDSIYSATKNKDAAESKWDRNVKAFHRTGPDSITKLFQAEVECMKDEAAILLKGAKSTSTTSERHAAEELLAELIDDGFAEELDVEYAD